MEALVEQIENIADFMGALTALAEAAEKSVKLENKYRIARAEAYMDQSPQKKHSERLQHVEKALGELALEVEQANSAMGVGPS